MKKSLLSMALFLGLSSQAFGFGVHGGLNFMNANINGSNSDTGFLLGVHFDGVLVPELLSLRPEINLNRVGAENNSFGGAGTTRFTYIEVPLLLKLSLYTPVIEFFALAGPKLAYLVKTTTSVSGFVINSSDRKDHEFGFYLGGGIGLIPKGATRFHLIGRYVFGLTDIDESNSEWKSSGFQLLASLTF